MLPTSTSFPTPTPRPSATPLSSPEPTSASANLPADIPLPPGDLQELFTSKKMVSFLSAADFKQLLIFYENQMALNGWEKLPEGAYIITGAAQLNFSKSERKVSISFRFNAISGLTGIVITIQE